MGDNCKIFFVLLVCLMAIQAGGAWGSPLMAADYVRKDLVFVSYYRHHGFGNYDKAYGELTRISKLHQGTEYGACALFLLSTDDSLAPAEQQHYGKALLSQYPDSRYSFALKANRAVNGTLSRHSLNELNQLLYEVGGPDLFSIMENCWHDYNADDILPQYREEVSHLIKYLATRFSKIDRDTAINFYLFLRNKFPLYSKGSIEMKMRSLVLQNNGLSLGDVAYTERNPPIIKVENEGLFSGKGISFTVTDGDISQSQVDLSRLVFTVNGMDVTQGITVRSEIDRSARFDLNDPCRIPFEILRITLQPSWELEPGVHAVYVRVQDGTGNRAEKSWAVNVP